MDNILVLLVIIVGILFATGLWKGVFQGLISGIIKLALIVVVLVLVVGFLYQKFIG